MDIHPSLEYFIGFNGTACKMIVIEQPDIKVSKRLILRDSNGSINKYIT